VNIESRLHELLGTKLSSPDVEDLSKQLLRGGESGGELGPDALSQERWIQRIGFHLVWLDFADYTRALIRSIWLAPRFAGTDFGTSRQRDLAQVWTDAARGFLGELAFQKFLDRRFQVSVKLSSRRGSLEEFLPSDIDKIQKPGEHWRKPYLRVSIKTTKFNGRWLDLPGAQFEHSDVFVLVKLGISRIHFLSFLKNISFMRDKLIPRARELGELNEAEAQELWDELPDFAPIPAYIAGFLDKEGLSLPIHQLTCDVKGRTRRRIEVAAGVGLFSRTTLRDHPEIKRLDPSGKLPIVIDPIIDSLTDSSHFLANSGALAFGRQQWEGLIGRL
jgi:hypothetical protein